MAVNPRELENLRFQERLQERVKELEQAAADDLLAFNHANEVVGKYEANLERHQQAMQEAKERIEYLEGYVEGQTEVIDVYVTQRRADLAAFETQAQAMQEAQKRIKELEDREWVAALFMEDVDKAEQVQAMQGLQAQNHRLMTQLGEEIAESDELVKQRDDLTQQLAEQRAEMQKLQERVQELEVAYSVEKALSLRLHAENEARQSEA
jgi:chromosome segregation ATPase